MPGTLLIFYCAGRFIQRFALFAQRFFAADVIVPDKLRDDSQAAGGSP
jgi:hypothetical protein